MKPPFRFLTPLGFAVARAYQRRRAEKTATSIPTTTDPPHDPDCSMCQDERVARAFEHDAKIREIAFFLKLLIPAVLLFLAALYVNLASSSMEGSVVEKRSPIGETTAFSLAIDDLQLKKLDFFKIDVEGAELEVLRGASKTIERCKPKIVIEVEPGADGRCRKVKQFLHEVDYEVVGMQRNLTFDVEPLTEENMDLVALWHCAPKPDDQRDPA